MQTGRALDAAIALSRQRLIDAMKRSALRGRGGAGFPAGLKWEGCRNAAGAALIEGRPYWEGPVVVRRLCGICPVSHHIAAAKAMDLIACYGR